jgi:hypothetical protein
VAPEDATNEVPDAIDTRPSELRLSDVPEAVNVPSSESDERLVLPKISPDI